MLLERSLSADFKLIVEDADRLSDPLSLIFRSSARLQKRSVTGLSDVEIMMIMIKEVVCVREQGCWGKKHLTPFL